MSQLSFCYWGVGSLPWMKEKKHIAIERLKPEFKTKAGGYYIHHWF